MSKKDELTLKAIEYLKQKDLYDLFLLVAEKSRKVFDDDTYLNNEYTINELYNLIKFEVQYTESEFSNKIKHLIRLGFMVYTDFRYNTIFNKEVIENSSYSVSPYFEKTNEYETSDRYNEKTKLMVSYDAYISGDDVFNLIQYNSDMKKIEENMQEILSDLYSNTDDDKSMLGKISKKAGQGIIIIIFILLILSIAYIFLSAIGVDLPSELDDVFRNLIELR